MSRNQGRLQSRSISTVDVFEENERLRMAEAEKEQVMGSCLPCFGTSDSWKKRLKLIKMTHRKRIQNKFGIIGAANHDPGVETEVVLQRASTSALNNHEAVDAGNDVLEASEQLSSAYTGTTQHQTETAFNATLEQNMASMTHKKAVRAPLYVVDRLKGSLLHVQLVGASRLIPTQLSGLADPYCKISVGSETYCSRPALGTLEPRWQETYTFKGDDIVSASNGIISFEIWSYDDFHPDPFQGQAELNLKTLPIRDTCTSRIACSLKLYVLRTFGHKAKGDFGELHLRVWLTPDTGEKGPVLAPAGFQSKCVEMALRDNLTMCPYMVKTLPNVVHSSMGALYEEPCVVFIRVAVERLIGIRDVKGDLGVVDADGLTSSMNKAASSSLLGTGSSNILKIFRKASASPAGLAWPSTGVLKQSDSLVSDETSGDTVSRSSFTSSNKAKAQKLFTRKPKSRKGMPAAIHEDAVLGGADEADDTFSSQLTDEQQDLDNLFDGAEEDKPEVDESEGNITPVAAGSDSLFVQLFSSYKDAAGSLRKDVSTVGSAKERPAWVYMRMAYAQQVYVSRLVRLHQAKGEARFKQDFVFAAVRPLVNRPLEISVYLTHNKRKPGHRVTRLSEDVTEMLWRCQRAEETRAAWLSGANGTEGYDEGPLLKRSTVGPEFSLPLLHWQLKDPLNGLIEMHLGAADVDYRPFIHNVPLFHKPPSSPAMKPHNSNRPWHHSSPVSINSGTAGTAVASRSSPVVERSSATSSKSKPFIPAQQTAGRASPVIQSMNVTLSEHFQQSGIGVSPPYNPSKSVTESIIAASATSEPVRSYKSGGATLANASRAASPHHKHSQSIDITTGIAYYDNLRTPQSPHAAGLPAAVASSPLLTSTAAVSQSGLDDHNLSLGTKVVNSVEQQLPDRIADVINQGVLKSPFEIAANQISSLPTRHFRSRAKNEPADTLLSELQSLSLGTSPGSKPGLLGGTSRLPEAPGAAGASRIQEWLQQNAASAPDSQPPLQWDQLIPQEGIMTPTTSVSRQLQGSRLRSAVFAPLWEYSVQTLKKASEAAMSIEAARKLREMLRPLPFPIPKQDPGKARLVCQRPPPLCQIRPLGTLDLKLVNVNITLHDVYFFLVLKCGSHWDKYKTVSSVKMLKCGSRWVRTNTRHSSDKSPWNWEISLPIYDPATPWSTVVLYHKSDNPKASDIHLFSRRSLTTNSVPPNEKLSRRFTLCMLPPDGLSSDEQPKKKDKGASSVSAGAVLLATTPGSGASSKKQCKLLASSSDYHPSHLLVVDHELKISYPRVGDVVSSYKEAPRPSEWYLYGLEDFSPDQLKQQQDTIVHRWLERCNPSLPLVATQALVQSRRQNFKLSQVKTNAKRVMELAGILKSMADGWHHLQSWSKPRDSLLAYALIISACLFPSKTFVGLLVYLLYNMYNWFMESQEERRRFWKPLRTLHSTTRSTTGTMPMDGTSPLDPQHSSYAAASGTQSCYAEQQDAVGDYDSASGSDDDAPDASNNPLSRLKRSYNQAIRIALLAQNLLDDLAVLYERLHGLFVWRDYLASLTIFSVLALAAVLIYIFGLQFLIIATGLYVLRPPQYRDPLPTPPEAFFSRLVNVHVHKKQAVLDGRVELVGGHEVVVLHNNLG
ncbi:hypothetical protein CEUSTIGMA_g6412.t1 [Chlamydomonas eustigma]|uniref:C2 domain-containing protein n=1 Tax=Chlamydomonas eustigma TaxID=1157962 RepID=A0A250X7W3_9CHLO|nr:hypothetical protein CEUSTIGMA_g6412.t1 [Chlamydomonas eustigma]|eukprot:GAX78972.1 hypothetical protein CEUSTIGMA_g6412.t1 [Chlamydomonas eustigma]